MKQTLSFCIILLFLISFQSCEKDPFDYRSKYVGTWNFSFQVKAYNAGIFDQSNGSSVSFLGSINYGENDDELSIYYIDSTKIKISINKEGEITSFPTEYCFGKFDGSDQLNLQLFWKKGTSGFMSHDLIGTKN
jgi:hypothetical protein